MNLAIEGICGLSDGGEKLLTQFNASLVKTTPRPSAIYDRRSVAYESLQAAGDE